MADREEYYTHTHTDSKEDLTGEEQYIFHTGDAAAKGAVCSEPLKKHQRLQNRLGFSCINYGGCSLVLGKRIFGKNLLYGCIITFVMIAERGFQSHFTLSQFYCMYSQLDSQPLLCLLLPLLLSYCSAATL